MKLGRYRHFKDQHSELIDVAQHSETSAAMAVYRALYTDHDLWVRPFGMFFQTIQ
ncbi:MAG: DUF1653 domain-containing protein [Proteobacteria bacterium]|nr:DUF1653 domain-containing protein [Pseudomonadota bacterium]